MNTTTAIPHAPTIRPPNGVNTSQMRGFPAPHPINNHQLNELFNRAGTDTPAFMLPSKPCYQGVYWKAMIGYLNYAILDTVRCWTTITTRDKRPSLQLMAQSMGTDIHTMRDRLPTLQGIGLLDFTTTGAGIRRRYQITAVARQLPFLTHSQAETLPSKLRKLHAQFIQSSFGETAMMMWLLAHEASFPLILSEVSNAQKC